MRAYAYIFAAFSVLAAPLVMRWLHGDSATNFATDENAPHLVIITPDDQNTRNEFRWAFSDWHQKKYGEPVILDYRNPGGTNDVKLELQTIYQAIRAQHNGMLPPEDQINTGIDVALGGGDYFFDVELKSLGILRPIDIDPAQLAQIFPQPTLAGVKLYDYQKDKSGNPLPPRWIGICLSSFGIVYNQDLFESLQLPAPKTWTDLADPRLAGNLALADPTHSATAAITYTVIIQRAMADAETEFFHRPENQNIPKEKLKTTTEYQQSLDIGFSRGMQTLTLIAANARYFTDSSSVVPTDVSFGNAAAGMAVDFYGQVTQETVGPRRQTFILPQGATAITPDPVGILYGTHGKQLELANHFIEFLLSPQGQRLWILNPNQPGGPRLRALHRPPIRQDVYTNRSGWSDDTDYFTDANGFNERAAWMGMMTDLRPIWAAAWIDDRDDLLNAYHQILSVSDPVRRQQLLEKFSQLPLTRPELNILISQRKSVEKDPSADANLWAAQQRIQWAKKFREHYQQVATGATP